MKIDTVGNSLWDYQYDNNGRFDFCEDVIQTKDGGYVMLGGTQNQFADSVDILIIKVDSTGKLVFATSINPVEKEKAAIIIFPNPATTSLGIKTTASIQSVKIYNLQGQLVLEGRSENLDISALSAQAYLVQVVTDKGFLKTKLVKQ